MTSIGTFEAKTHLTQLLGRVAQGERILITNRGAPVAMLVPPEAELEGDTESVVAEMFAARDQRGPTLGRNLTARQLREEGRRF
jgi:prevent-host-death family protein